MDEVTVDGASGMQIRYELPDDAPESVRAAAQTVAFDAIAVMKGSWPSPHRRCHGIHSDLQATADVETQTVVVRLKQYPDGNLICRWRKRGRAERLGRITSMVSAVADLNAALKEDF